MDKKRVLIVFGGCSSEHEVSLQSAHAVLSHLDTEHFEVVPVGITAEGKWFYFAHGWQGLLNGGWETCCVPCTLSLDRSRRGLLLLDGSGQCLPLDAVFPILHGRNGEDGTIQGACELAGLPVIGCGTLSSALCMDKERAHRLVEAAGIRVPKSKVFASNAPRAEMEAAAKSIGFPLFAKPLRAGSSFGASRVECIQQLSGALDNASAFDNEMILEEAIPGFEVGCAVIGCGELTVGAIDEVELETGFFDYEEKYTLKSAKIHCPARISSHQAAQIQQAAKTVYRALNCRVMARVDLFLTPEGEIVFNEVNTIPGFTAHSRFPTMMCAGGLTFSELITRLIELGVQA